MRNLDIAILRTYVVVAETRSFVSTSKIVGRTVAAISYQMAKLEEVVGHKLLLRDGRAVILSEIGHQFVIYARSLLQTNDQIINRKWSSNFPSIGLNSFENDITQPSATLPVRNIRVFEDNLETLLLRTVFSFWKSYRNEGKLPSLDDLIKKGILSLRKDNLILLGLEQSNFRVIGASSEPTRLFQFDKYGFGITADQMWKSPKIFESRSKIFSICRDITTPVFYSGNAPIPWHSDSYSSTIDRFSSTRLDRLLLPIKVGSQAQSHIGILQIAEFRGRLNLPIKQISGLSQEEHAANLDLIGNVAVAT